MSVALSVAGLGPGLSCDVGQDPVWGCVCEEMLGGWETWQMRRGWGGWSGGGWTRKRREVEEPLTVCRDAGRGLLVRKMSPWGCAPKSGVTVAELMLGAYV